MAWTRRKPGSGSSSSAPLYISLAVVAAAAVAGVFWYRGRGSEPEPQDLAQLNATGPASEPVRSVPPLALPDLDASDAFLRDVVSSLSSHPQLARWLVTDELARRFVLSVVEMAGGRSPRAHVQCLIPPDAPGVRESGEGLTVDPEAYRRYDLLAETFASLDTDGTAVLYHQLHPLFEEAYAELGIPGGSFDEAMELAVQNVISAQGATGTLAVRPNESVYEFVDPELEARSPVEKHLIRMGPENAGRIQGKLLEIWGAIEVLRSVAPRP
jgi:hypothetical protein